MKLRIALFVIILHSGIYKENYHLFFHQTASEVGIPKCGIVQPFSRITEPCVLPDNVLPEPLRLQGLYGYQFRGLNVGSRLP